MDKAWRPSISRWEMPFPRAAVIYWLLNSRITVERVRRIVRGQNYDEIITYSFISPKDYELLRLDEEGKKAIRILNISRGKVYIST